MTSALNGRVTRLEATYAPPDPDNCRRCGLRHVQPLTMDLARRVLGPASLMASGPWSESAGEPIPRLCLCLDCCADGHAIARLTHGLPPQRGAT